MAGWDDDASHSQVICPSEDSELNLCSNLPGGMFSSFKQWNNVCILDLYYYDFWSEMNTKYLK